jgi:hypothetical protein
MSPLISIISPYLYTFIIVTVGLGSINYGQMQTTLLAMGNVNAGVTNTPTSAPVIPPSPPKLMPSILPTVNPSPTPSNPTTSPTAKPSPLPSISPKFQSPVTNMPSFVPSTAPTAKPSPLPTYVPNPLPGLPTLSPTVAIQTNIRSSVVNDYFMLIFLSSFQSRYDIFILQS